MGTATETPNGQIRKLTREDSMNRLARATRGRLRTGGEEFLRAWESGKFDANPDRPNELP
jgi:hypothetical protein